MRIKKKLQKMAVMEELREKKDEIEKTEQSDKVNLFLSVIILTIN